MEELKHHGYIIQLASERLPEGTWSARALVFRPESEGEIHPISDPSTLTFLTEEEANAYASELAVLWIENHPC